LSIECCSGTAVEFKGTTNCLIAGCTLRNIGDINGSGIDITDGKNNGVSGNDISEVGRHGIAIYAGNKVTLEEAGNYADNNHIHRMGVYFKEGCGVNVTGCGNRVTHNLIHDGPRFAVQAFGTKHLVEYNHIHDVCLETQDTGAVYTSGRDWIGARGTVIRYNYIHDIVGFGQKNANSGPEKPRSWDRFLEASGIYLDDNSGGVDLIGNVVSRCSLACIHLHDARDTLIMNNIFLNAKQCQTLYGGWTSTHHYWTRFHDGMVKGYQSIKDQPAWQGMRNIGISPDESVLTNGLVMIGNQFYCNVIDYQDSAALYRAKNIPFDRNVFDYNLVFHHGLPITNEVTYVITNAPKVTNTWEGWRELGNDQHSLIADPLFVDPGKGDYTIRPESPAYGLGFKQIPMDKIGPYPDEMRASWPIDTKVD